MQGLWKERVSGWNNKDSKRKKQTRRNSFKDKAKGIASRGEWSLKFNRFKSKKNKNSRYSINSNDVHCLIGIYGIDFKCHRDWVTVYPETQGIRKSAQKLANRTTRAKVRAWISLKDYDMDIEIKNHALEKSIAWEIH